MYCIKYSTKCAELLDHSEMFTFLPYFTVKRGAAPFAQPGQYSVLSTLSKNGSKLREIVANHENRKK